MPTSFTDRINALEFLTLSHVIAAARLTPGLSLLTIAQAEEFARKLTDDGYPASAQHLQALTDAIRVGCDLPVND